MQKQVLGIKIDDVAMDEAIEIVLGWLKKRGPASPAKRGEKYYIVTPNPEIIMIAQGDEKFKNILNKADLSLPDGVGLKLTTDIVCHTPGIDFMEELINVSCDYGFTIGLLGGKDGVAKKASECLRKKYPKLKISFAESGGEVDKNGNFIRTTNYQLPTADLLFVAVGPPKQEKWIAQNLNNIPVKVAMGVGGAFDFLSGQVPRAPKIIRNLGFEWLFRLMIQPWRIKRQLALLKYLLLILK